jgi:hypothetical protein
MYFCFAIIHKNFYDESRDTDNKLPALYRLDD